MHRRGPGYQPMEEDHERRRRLDAASLPRCQCLNERRQIQGLRIVEERAAAAPPPPPPPPLPPQLDDHPSMTVEEVQHHERNYIPAPSDRRLSDGWMPNVDNVPVAPRLTGQARLDYIR